MQKRSLRDFKPLKTKAFDFSSKDVVRNMSANNVANEKSGVNPFTISDLINRQSSNTLSQKPKGVADLPGFESTLDSMGSINIKENSVKYAEARDRVAAVVDLNKNTSFPLTQQRKKNKNDFYRFLLQQNFGTDEEELPLKCNNDILIPRSILKRNEGVPKPPVELDDFDELLNDAEQLAAKESIVGKGVDMNGPLVSPRLVNQNYLENLYRKMEVRD